MAQSSMDVDFGFDELECDDILLIEQTEQIYLNTQQSQQTTTSPQTSYEPLRNEPAGSMNWNPAQEAIEPVKWDPTQHAIKLEEEEVVLAESNIDTSPVGVLSNSQFGPEAERVFEQMKFQIERLEMTANNNDTQQQNEEIMRLNEQLKEKERETIQLKKELYKFKEQYPSDSQQKRSFPGLNIYDKTKSKRIATKPSPFTMARTNSAMSSQASSSSQVIEYIPDNRTTAKMPRLAAMASPMISSSSSSRQLTNIRAESESPHNQPLIVDRPKPDTPRKIRKPTEMEGRQKLLIVLLTPQFLKWNSEKFNNGKDINTALTKQLIRDFSIEFSHQFVPDPGQSCPSLESDRLQLLASDIVNSLIKGESAQNTIRTLLNIFNIAIKIAIKCKLIKIIHHIVDTTNVLTKNFPIARKYLQRDITFDSSSLLAQFAKSLALFPMYQVKRPQLSSTVSNPQDLTFEEIDRISATSRLEPSQIYKELHSEKSTGEATAIVEAILELFMRVGSGCKESIFTFLVTDSVYLKLINIEKPYDIIYTAMSVLETSLTNESSLANYNDDKITVVHCLTTLLLSYPKQVKSLHWYNICIKIFALLELILAADLSNEIAVKVCKLILEKVYEAMDIMSASYKEAGQSSNTIREHRDSFVKFGLQLIYSSIKWCPESVFEHTRGLRADAILQMVHFFQNNMQMENSLSRTLNKLTTLLSPKKRKTIRGA